MALVVDQITAVAFALGVPEMIEAGAEHGRQRRETRDVPAEVAAIGRMQTVRLDDHRHCVPAHVGAQPLLDLDVSRGTFLLVGGDRIDVGGICRERQVDTGLACMVNQFGEQEVGALATLGTDDGRQGVEPFTCFLCVGVVGRGAEK